MTGTLTILWGVLDARPAADERINTAIFQTLSHLADADPAVLLQAQPSLDSERSLPRLLHAAASGWANLTAATATDGALRNYFTNNIVLRTYTFDSIFTFPGIHFQPYAQTEPFFSMPSNLFAGITSLPAPLIITFALFEANGTRLFTPTKGNDDGSFAPPTAALSANVPGLAENTPLAALVTYSAHAVLNDAAAASTPLCAWWDYNRAAWNPAGCSAITDAPSGRVHCQCNVSRGKLVHALQLLQVSNGLQAALPAPTDLHVLLPPNST